MKNYLIACLTAKKSEALKSIFYSYRYALPFRFNNPPPENRLELFIFPPSILDFHRLRFNTLLQIPVPNISPI